MKQIVMLNRVSLDGFFAGPNGEIDWFIHDPAVDKAAHEFGGADTVLFGRVTYQMFEAHWPAVGRDPNAPKEARATAEELRQMTKVVFSKTMKGVTWENSRLAHNPVVEEVKQLRQAAGSALITFGSGTIVQQLANKGLIDDYFLVVTPVILGQGKPLFKDVQKLNLKLVESRGFASGNVLLHYKPLQP